jgi:hypothetical protein
VAPAPITNRENDDQSEDEAAVSRTDPRSAPAYAGQFHLSCACSERTGISGATVTGEVGPARPSSLFLLLLSPRIAPADPPDARRTSLAGVGLAPQFVTPGAFLTPLGDSGHSGGGRWGGQDTGNRGYSPTPNQPPQVTHGNTRSLRKNPWNHGIRPSHRMRVRGGGGDPTAGGNRRQHGIRRDARVQHGGKQRLGNRRSAVDRRQRRQHRGNGRKQRLGRHGRINGRDRRQCRDGRE